MDPTAESRPSWDRLYATAAGQEGHFTTAQAAEAGYSTQLLNKHLKSGRIARVRRAIYRIVHYPVGEHEDLVVLWLWSEHAGVFSHETALALHQLSDVLPSRAHLTLPASWKTRRLRVPDTAILHHADLEPADRTWYGCLPVTTPARTLCDCAANHLSPELLEQALREGLDRGLFRREHVAPVHEYLASFERSSR